MTDEQKRQQLQALLGELSFATTSLSTALSQPTSLVGVMAWVKAIDGISSRLVALEMTFDEQADLAVEMVPGFRGEQPTARLYDLNTMRAPDSPEGLS